MSTEPTVTWLDVRTLAPGDTAVLPDAERARVARLRRAEDRAARTAAAYLLRAVVAEATGLDPASVVVDRTCATCGEQHGRPTLPGTDLHVSVTHAGPVVGVALGETPLGLDVEDPARFTDPALAAEVLGDGERADTPDHLCRTWVRKEAVVEATGDGIVVGLRGVRVTPADAPPALLAHPDRPDLALMLGDIAAPEGCAAALAVLPGARGGS